MSKYDPKLQAFPAWAMGQVLLPIQFHALQAAVVSQIAVRAELSGLPAHGVARLHLHEGVLESEGAIAIKRLTYIFRAPGPIVDVPGNTVVTNLNVDKYKTELANGPLSVYLHLLNTPFAGKRPERYVDDDRSLGRELFQAELSLSPTHDDARESVKLFELTHHINNGWQLTEYAPPLARVGGKSSPYLTAVFEAIQSTLRVIKGQTQRDIADDFLSREHASELRRVRASVTRMLAHLDDLALGGTFDTGVSEHPFPVFRELRDFYLETASNLEHAPLPTPVYDHEDLAGCFRSLNTLLHGLECTAALNPNALEFERTLDQFEIKQLPTTLAKATSVYFIIKFGLDDTRPRSNEEIKRFLDRFKIASPRRAVSEVVTRSLSGVRLEALDPTTAAIFSPKFGSDALCCWLDIQHSEWMTAMRDGGLRIPISKGLDHLRCYLVWNGTPPGAADKPRRDRGGA
jgi:type VI secretion system protein ImpJ